MRPAQTIGAPIGAALAEKDHRRPAEASAPRNETPAQTIGAPIGAIGAARPSALISPSRGGSEPGQPLETITSRPAYRRGVARARAALALPPEPEPPVEQCTFGIGLRCTNGDDCHNPNHRPSREHKGREP